MDLLFIMLVPFLMLAVALWGLVRRVDLWGALTDGAEKGLKVSLRIMPPLIGGETKCLPHLVICSPG